MEARQVDALVNMFAIVPFVEIPLVAFTWLKTASSPLP